MSVDPIGRILLECCSKGALVGGVLGFAFPMWLSIGAYVTKPSVMKPMQYSVECCHHENETATTPSYTTDDVTSAMCTAAVTMTTVKPETYVVCLVCRKHSQHHCEIVGSTTLDSNTGTAEVCKVYGVVLNRRALWKQTSRDRVQGLILKTS